MKLFGIFLLSILFVADAYCSTKNQTISGNIQGLTYSDPSVTIEITENGHRTFLILGPKSFLQTRGITEDVLTIGSNVKATGWLKTGQKQDELQVESLSVGGKTYKLSISALK